MLKFLSNFIFYKKNTYKMSKIVPFKDILKQCLDRHHGKYTYIEDSYRGSELPPPKGRGLLAKYIKT